MKGWQWIALGCGTLFVLGPIGVGVFGRAAILAGSEHHGGSPAATQANAAGEASDAPADIPPPWILSVTVRDVARAYQADRAAAQQRYDRHPLRVTGMIARIELGRGGAPRLQMRTTTTRAVLFSRRDGITGHWHTEVMNERPVLEGDQRALDV